MRGLFVYLCLFVGARVTSGARDKEAEKTSEFWRNVAQQELENAIQAETLNKKVAKNVIIFLGDGMGVSTITAGRILKGQLQGDSGEEHKLAMDKLPHAALSKTYSVDRQVSDSAATATAYLCGVKTNWFMLGQNAATGHDNCQSSKGNEVDSVLVDFYKNGRSTGIVTTTRINHATPGAAYAHVPNRQWYGDSDLPDEAKVNGCKDIAMQFYDSSDMITVAMGGGRKYFQPNNTNDPEYTSKSNAREDGQDLIEMWKNKMADAGQTAKYVWNQEQFDAVDASSTDRLLGLFQPKDMQYDAGRLQDEAGEPSLAEMTTKAIEILRKNDKGYFLLVEGGRIDHGHHASSAYLALRDLVAFDGAIEKAVEMTSQDETLIIVTADHSHVVTMGGYSERGNNIFGLAPSQEKPELALDSKPYTTVMYANGPGFQGHYGQNEKGYTVPLIMDNLSRADISDIELDGHDYHQQSAVPLSSETHGGEDVAILASGPMAHLFHGVHEQNYIAHVMRYASCVGPDRSHCTEEMDTDTESVNYLGSEISTTAAESTLMLQFIFLLILSGIIVLLLIFILKNWARFRGVNEKSTEPIESAVPLT